MADEFKQSSFLDPLGRRQQQRWIDAAQRRAAEKAAWFARPAEDVAADMARLEELLFTRAKWTFASTMAADNPHSYCLRRQWARDWPTGNDDFVWTVQTIRIIADREKFPERGPFARWYTVLHLGGAKFWPMNFPIDWPSGRWCTILINRKPPFLPGDQR